MNVGAHAFSMRTFCIVKHYVTCLTARIKVGCGSRFNQQHCLWCGCAPAFDLYVELDNLF